MTTTLAQPGSSAPAATTAVGPAPRGARIGPRLARLVDDSEKILVMMEDRLPGGVGHARLVAEAMAALGTEIGLSDDHVEQLTCVGLLHDIGCAAWPAQLLAKPGRWNTDDIARARNHPLAGASIVAEVSELRVTGPWIAQHHERLDGRGYPHNLGAAKLAPEGRMLAVVEVFAASVTPRTSRSPITPAQTMTRLQEAATHGLPLAQDEAVAGLVATAGEGNGIGPRGNFAAPPKGYGEPSLDPGFVEALLAVLQRALPEDDTPLARRTHWPPEGVTFDSPALRNALRETFRAVAGDLLAAYERHAGYAAAQRLRGDLGRNFAAQQLPVAWHNREIEITPPANWRALQIAAASRRALALQVCRLGALLPLPHAVRFRDATYSRLTTLGQELAERYELFDGFALSHNRPGAAPALNVAPTTNVTSSAEMAY